MIHHLSLNRLIYLFPGIFTTECSIKAERISLHWKSVLRISYNACKSKWHPKSFFTLSSKVCFENIEHYFSKYTTLTSEVNNNQIKHQITLGMKKHYKFNILMPFFIIWNFMFISYKCILKLFIPLGKHYTVTTWRISIKYK